MIKNYQAGRLGKYQSFWKTLTSNQWVLNTVIGARIIFDQKPVQCKIPKEIELDIVEEKIMGEKIIEMLQKGIIIPAPEEDDGEYISNIFLRPKKDGSHRVILNLKQLNENINKKHFKLQSLNTAVQLMTQGCYMASVDWKDAYYSLPINSNDQKYLRFYWKRVKYQYTVLPNGLSSGPRDFTKIAKVIYSNLRELGFLNSSYIDDSFLAGENVLECQNNVMHTVEMGINAGFIPHPLKSVFVPTQIIEYLGFILNSQKMVVMLTKRKKKDLLKLCTKTVGMNIVTIQTIAELIGKMVAAVPGVEYGPLFYRRLDNDKSKALKLSKGNYQALMKLSEKVKVDLKWWIDNIDTAFKPISKHKYQVTLQTDASNSGWGGVLINEERNRTGGFWSHDESQLHINQKELLAVLLTIKALCKNVKDKHIRIQADNTTTVAYINKMGGTKANCYEIVRKIWNWAIQNGNWLSACHIAGKLNIEADVESRRSQFDTEYQLHPDIFKNLCKIWGSPQVDLFASRINYQVPIYFSWKPDPGASSIDAIAQTWSEFELTYAFPPFSLIGKVLQKLKEEGGEAIIVVPMWPGQPWFSQLLHMCNRLYCFVTQNEYTEVPNSRPECKAVPIHGLPIIGKKLQDQGFLQQAVGIIMDSWRPSTQKQYKAYLVKWTKFCDSRNINPLLPNAMNVVEFITELYHTGLGYSALNTAKSAVCNLQLTESLGQNPLIGRVMKGIFLRRPSLPNNNVMWDTEVILLWLKKMSLVNTLSLKNLTRKLVILIAILTGQRAQTMNKILLNNVTKSGTGYSIRIGDILKQTKPGKHQYELFLGAYPPDRRLCVVTVWKEYESRTKLLRGNHQELLISFVKPHGPITVSTVSRWVKGVLQEAGVDMNIFTPHSTRGASTSRAVTKSVPITTILQTAGWFKESTFTKFYKKSIVKREQFGQAILSQT